MTKSLQLVGVVLAIGFACGASRPAAAQGFDTPKPATEGRTNETDYNQSAYTNPSAYTTATPHQTTPREFVQQNAQWRADQRHMRMASMEWYGMSNSRPTASPTPFASLYSPAWQMPGGRPYAWWYPGVQPSNYLILR